MDLIPLHFVTTSNDSIYPKTRLRSQSMFFLRPWNQGKSVPPRQQHNRCTIKMSKHNFQHRWFPFRCERMCTLLPQQNTPPLLVVASVAMVDSTAAAAAAAAHSVWLPHQLVGLSGTLVRSGARHRTGASECSGKMHYSFSGLVNRARTTCSSLFLTSGSGLRTIRCEIVESEICAIRNCFGVRLKSAGKGAGEMETSKFIKFIMFLALALEFQ